MAGSRKMLIAAYKTKTHRHAYGFAETSETLLSTDCRRSDRWIPLDVVVEQYTGDDHSYERDRQEHCVGIVSWSIIVSHVYSPFECDVN